ncbi:hypothetical protein OHA72_42670 [Dactylosporangium sp. NBC_01737]|uniref:hypothetical protein n=1 Tax=Dactylosporangium sp. NBC_01737 TaxID=2975959 RepID=UPI002E0DC79B|nr:hypothetical protein OHA72_42670 [Dactylosporangium sp. NBC_01737]
MAKPKKPKGGDDGTGGGSGPRRHRTGDAPQNVPRAQDIAGETLGDGRLGGGGNRGGNQGGGARRNPNVPEGFRDFQDFQQYSTRVRDRMREQYPDLDMGFQGSAVTGRSADSGAPFDQGRTSDYDLAVSGESIYAAARERGITFRGDGVSTGPLSEADLHALGLDGIVADASADAGRPVHLMIFRTMDDAVARRPTIRVWF